MTWLLLAALSGAMTMRMSFAEEGPPNLAPHHGDASFAAGIAGRIQAHQRRALLRAPGPAEINAIGLPVAPRNVIREGGAEKFGVGPAPQFPAAAIGGTGAPGYGHGGFSGPANVRSSVSSIRTSADRGAIDGSKLIRPSLAPSALGGPAKSLAGINGTTWRPKH